MPKYKIAMLGPGGVGKTCLADRFCDVASDRNYNPTIEDSRYPPKYIVELVDTGDFDTFKQVQWITDNEGHIFVYDISSTWSFYEVQQLLLLARVILQDRSPIALVGNKTDKWRERKVLEEEGQKLAAHYGALFCETSAKSDTGVQELFKNQLNQMRAFRDASSSVIEEPATILKRSGHHHVVLSVSGAVDWWTKRKILREANTKIETMLALLHGTSLWVSGPRAK